MKEKGRRENATRRWKRNEKEGIKGDGRRRRRIGGGGRRKRKSKERRRAT